VVEDALQIPLDEECPGDLASRTERDRVADAVAANHRAFPVHAEGMPQPIFDRRADTDLDRCRRCHLEPQPRRSDPLQVRGVRVEGEDHVPPLLYPLLSFEHVDAHQTSDLDFPGPSSFTRWGGPGGAVAERPRAISVEYPRQFGVEPGER
jgi:hypothetical protein